MDGLTKEESAYERDWWYRKIVEDIRIRDRTLYLDIYYPRSPDMVNRIDIGLSDRTASDGIQVSYDFERDGWVIWQPTVLEWEDDDVVCDPCFKEVAFVQSWQFTDDIS